MFDWDALRIVALIGGSMAAILLPVRLWREAVTHWRALGEWSVRRRKRRETLDSILDGAPLCASSCRFDDDMGAVHSTLEDIERELKSAKRANEAQDHEISKSSAEFALHTKALFALLSGQRQQGCNGPVSAAYDDLKNYLNEKSHHIGG